MSSQQVGVLEAPNDADSDAAPSILEKGLERLRRTKPVDTWRAKAAGEVLLLETLHIAKRYKKSAFAERMYNRRVASHVSVLDEVLKDQCLVGQIPAVLALMEAAQAEARRALAEQVLGPFLHVHEVIAVCEEMLDKFGSRLTDLPDRVKEEIDSRLEALHRAHVVKGDEEFLDESIAMSESDLPPHEDSIFGLALSGGGIRSASFSIGMSQALSRFGYLPAFDYVSSVSGGGFASSWLTAWAYRHKRGIRGVSDELMQEGGKESGPLRWVRRHSSYLAPKLEPSLSGDTWALLTAYAANWAPILVLASMVILCLLTVPHLFSGAAQWTSENLAADSAWSYGLVLAGLLPMVVFLGIVRRLTMFYRTPTESVRYPHFVPHAVFIGATVATVFTSMALGAMMKMAFVAPVPGGYEDLLLGWAGPRYTEARIVTAVALIYILSGALAIFFASKTAQMMMDAVRVLILRKAMPAAGPMQRTVEHKSAVFFGVALSCISCCSAALLLLPLLKPAEKHDFDLLIAFGPAVILSVMAIAEMIGSLVTIPYQRDMDRAWAARVSGWVSSSILLWTTASCFALWAHRGASELCSHFLVFLEVAVAIGLLVAFLIWRKIGISWLVGGIFLAAYCVVIQGLYSAAFEAGFKFFDIKVDIERLIWPTLVAAVLMIVSAFVINVNRFSQHALYKQGLVRTFLGASRLSSRNAGIQEPEHEVHELEKEQYKTRKPDPITNIDEHDDPALAWLAPHEDRDLPIVLLNSAVNGESLTDSEGRAPRQWPFTFSSLFCGSPVSGVGYARTEDFYSLKKSRGLTLGTAMAVSGAAMSPTSGKSTKTIRAILFGMLNARLGVWLGNPREKEAVIRDTPALAGFTIIREMLGIRSPLNKWIHLSDGGHFENLGVYELLRRGCNRIVAVDASCDPDWDFTDFANAIRRARIDLGINITRRDEAQSPEVTDRRRWSYAQPKAPWKGWAWYDIDYGGDLPKGRLFYIKPSNADIEAMPVEVVQYWKRSKSFPHETTADQFFTEAQMEAYRALGYKIGIKALESILDADPMFYQSVVVRSFGANGESVKSGVEQG